jgi:nucleotide-binding universal stress UspA family protein
METDKLLYVTDLEDSDLPFELVKGIFPLADKLFSEVVFLSPSSSKKWTVPLSDSPIPLKIETAESFSSAGIMNVAIEEGSTLMVVDLDRTYRDSFLKWLLLNSSIPVLVADRNKLEEKLFDRIILGISSFPPSEQILRRVTGFKEMIGCVDIVHVINEKLTVRDMVQLKKSMASVRKACVDEGIDAESHAYAGRVVGEILTAAKDYRGTMIVVGPTKGKIFSKPIFKENLAYRVVRNTDIPVLFVP